ncbi:hypothetical protein ET475_02195 [Microbacterium protaetiae]|uniref:Beta-xylanase n=1 Tax=Microbacterium protaetiae TaxID=2509458 RepID=A0A4P6EA53_9MICO|nr:endo-1,4-beta-xylanase [Microbacterium protaetiae]QAY58925.1 hypothetical protein ET475_02195 [Microbacterium protaetiae]
MIRRLRTALSVLAAAALVAAPFLAPATPAAAASTPVSSVDFEDGTTGTWTQSGNPTLAVVPDPLGGSGQVLSITNRTNSWDGVQSPEGLFTEGTQYTFSARVLVPDVATTAHFIVKADYAWVGDTPVPAGVWTTVTGTYTADDNDSSTYVEVADETADYYLDDIVITAEGASTPPATQAPGTVLVDADFESGLGDWAARAGAGDSSPTVAVVDGGADGTAHAAQVSDRASEGDGIQLDTAGILLAGATYHFDGYVRFAPGADPGRGLTVSMRTVNGGSTAFSNLIQVENASATDWTHVTGDFTVPGYDTAAEIYVEARYNSGNTASFLVDQVRITVPEAAVVDTSLTPLKDSVDFPVGVAVDERETTGAAAQLLLHHFDQITPENHMKVEAWYDADHHFVRSSQATALLDFAQANGLRLYGHVLVWHSQTPEWFFQDDSGRELTSSTADKQILRDRLKTHIFDVAKSIADDYGLYGSATNPMVAWDVVNEVVADQATDDGLRTSRWHDVLGEEYIPLAFEYADEAFNKTYAAPGTDRPVKLFINDYNTEQDRKGAQYEALVKRLLAAGVPVDGVGHQFHVSATTPISSLRAALQRFSGLGLQQEITELDVTITSADQPNLIRQGYYYRDLFDVLRAYQAAAPADEKLFSVTLWGLDDARSWRSEQKPLLFDGDLQAKPAYYGAIGDDAGLPALVNTADVFGGDVLIADGFENDPAWTNLPEHALTDDAGGFQLRWNADHLTALVRTMTVPERIEFSYGDKEFTYQPGGALAGRTVTVEGTSYTVVHLPHSGVTQGSSATFDVRVYAGGALAGAWNTTGATGMLSLLEPLSFVQVPAAHAAPAIDGAIDETWQNAPVVHTSTTVEGSSDGATADVRTLWHDDTLYVLYDVTDPVADNSNSDPWNQDSVELFLDLGNEKAGPYGPNATQIRVTADNKLSFGTGDAAAQQARVLSSATARTATGYIVELAIAMTGQSGGQNDVPLGGENTFHGIDFQVNDGRDGARYAVHTWAEPTGSGYQTTARWGVAQLVAALEPGEPGDQGGSGDTGTGSGDEGTGSGDTGTGSGDTGTGTDTGAGSDEGTGSGDTGNGSETGANAHAWATIDVGSGVVEQGGELTVQVSGLTSGQRIAAVLHSEPLPATGIPAADASGSTAFTLAIPTDFALGAHTLIVSTDGADPIEIPVQVVAAGQLAVTGAQLPLGMLFLGALAIVIGGLLLVTRRRPGRDITSGA